MIDFSTLQGLTIPEGVVTQIADAQGNVLWSAVKPMCTVTMKQALIGMLQNIDGKIYVTLDGQTYKPTSGVSLSNNFATATVQSGTVMHCVADSSSAMMGNSTIRVNGDIVETAASALVEYDYKVKGDILAIFIMHCGSPMIANLNINITEIPEGCIAFVMSITSKSNASAAAAEYKVYIAERGMTWAEWINSAYNTDGYYYRTYTGDAVWSPDGYPINVQSVTTEPAVTLNDLITENCAYSTYSA